MRTLLTALALAPLTLGLAACGGDDDGGGGGPAKTFAKGQPVHVKGQEYKFDPGNIVVQGGGGSTTVEFENAGSLAHNLEIEQGSEKVAASPTFQGGETKSFTADLQPGDYTIICTVGDHAGLGMKGKLTVK
jgi:plastocyanin